MSPAGHRIEIWHHAVAQFVVIDDGLIAGMILGGNVPHFAQRPLAVSTIEGNEAAKLVPAGLQLAPLRQVAVLHASLVELLLGSHIAVFHAETALVHSPEGNARHRIVQSGGHLGAHILPAGCNVAAPGCRGVTLFSGKTATGEQEHAGFIGLSLKERTLSVVDGIGIHRAVGVEVFRRRTHRRGAAQGFAIPHGRAVAHVGFRGIHPPGIDAVIIFRIEILVHLAPEHLARTFGVGIVERNRGSPASHECRR